MQTQAENTTIQQIPVSAILPNPYNRRVAATDPDIAELAASIRAKGVVQPVILRPHPTDAKKFFLVAGERRWLATQKADNLTVPSIVRTDLTEAEAKEITIIENLQRKNLHPMEQARKFLELLTEHADTYTVEKLAETFGKDKNFIVTSIKLCDLIEPLQQLFEANRLTFTHARELCRLQSAQQQEALEYCFDRETDVAKILKDPHRTISVSVTALRDWIKHCCLLKLGNAPFDIKDPNLVPEAGACTKCPKRAGNNPALFSDIAPSQTCTDPGCYDTKRAALITITLKELAEKGKTPVKISDRYSVGREEQNAGILPTAEYKLVGKTDACPNSQPGVYVDGPNFSKTVIVCAVKDCSVHAARSRFRTPEQKKERTKQLAHERTEKTYRYMLARAVLKSFPKVPLHDDLLLLAQCTFDSIGHDNRRRVFAIYEWEQKKTTGGHGVAYVDYSDLVTAHLKKMDSAALHHFCFVCYLAADLFVAKDSTDSLAADSRLMRVAKRHEVATKDIRVKAAVQVAAARSKK